MGGMGGMGVFLICIVPTVAVCILWGLGGGGIVNLLEVVAAMVGGGGGSGSIFLGLDGLFGFGEDGC